MVGKCYCVNDLLYSVRSVCKNAPWFRKLFIVIADGESLPPYIDVKNKRVKIVRHSAIVPAQYLPTYNSNVIESYVHLIRGLTDDFVYMNDDMYVLKPVTPASFFERPGKPIIRHEDGPLAHNIAVKSDNMYVRMWQNAIKRFGLSHTRYHHQAMPYNRTALKRYYKRFGAEVAAASTHRIREPTDFNLLRFSTSLMVMDGTAVVVVTGAKSDLFMESTDAGAMRKLKTANQSARPTFLCINNNSNSTADVEKTLSSLLPDACAVEQPTIKKC
jgi:Stealth protein CR2, conserved region 2/Stealth protein CR3, conserved region 3